MAKHQLKVGRGPFTSRPVRCAGKGGWTVAPIPRELAPPVTRPWGRTPVLALVDGVSWNTRVWRDRKTGGALLAVPARVRGAKGSGDTVTVEFTGELEEDDASEDSPF